MELGLRIKELGIRIMDLIKKRCLGIETALFI